MLISQKKRAFFLIFFLGVVLLGGGCTLFLYNQFYGSAVDEDISIYVIDRSVEDEVLPYVENHWGFNFYAKRLDLQRRLKVGFYSLRRGDSVVDVVRQLSLGEQTEVRLTFNNIRNFSDLAARISTQIAADSTSLYSAFTQWEGGDTTRLFSKFIPNTYSLYWSITPESLIERMTRESDKFWSGGRDEKRNSLGFSREKIMTLASIVYEETKHIDEMPRVAGVYLNRLKRGMPLQADPTVKYAIGDFSIKRILYKHLEYDSPYNTYKYKGLPPSPISMPSIAAIDAVLSAESHNYLYFCARASFDGYHNFAKSYGEHLRYAREYSAALNKLKL